MLFLETANYNWLDLLDFKDDLPFKAGLNPSKLWRDLDRYKHDSKGLSNYFRKWKTKIEFLKPSRAITYLNYVAVGGEYDSEVRQSTIQIYTDQYNTFEWTVDSWGRFKQGVIQTLMHELIHMWQYVRRGDREYKYIHPYKTTQTKSKNNERLYLSSNDEVEAYAHCAFFEIQCYKYNSKVNGFLNFNKRNPSSTIRYYLKTFEYDKQNQATVRLFKHILKWQTKYKKLYSKEMINGGYNHKRPATKRQS